MKLSFRLPDGKSFVTDDPIISKPIETFLSESYGLSDISISAFSDSENGDGYEVTAISEFLAIKVRTVFQELGFTEL